MSIDRIRRRREYTETAAVRFGKAPFVKSLWVGAWMLTFAALAFPTSSGCGAGSDIQRAVVQGTVSYQGQPVANGQILFSPIDGTAGPVAGAPIASGTYLVENKGGVPVGNHRVSIEAYRIPPGGGNPDAPTPRVQYLPAKYNARSQLTINIPDGQSTVVHDFELDDSNGKEAHVPTTR